VTQGRSPVTIAHYRRLTSHHDKTLPPLWVHGTEVLTYMEDVEPAVLV